MLYHLLKSTLHSKANACNIGTFIRFYMQMWIEGLCFRMQSEIQQMVKLQTIDFIRKAGTKKTKHLPIECLQGTIIIYSVVGLQIRSANVIVYLRRLFTKMTTVFHYHYIPFNNIPLGQFSPFFPKNGQNHYIIVSPSESVPGYYIRKYGTLIDTMLPITK